MTYKIARDVRQYGISTVYFIAFSGFSACSFDQKVELIIIKKYLRGVKIVNYSAVILAAGKGVRMNSYLPKVAHRVAGKPLIAHVAGAVHEAGIDDITVVIGHGREAIKDIFANDEKIKFAVQELQLGTGHALMQAEDKIDPECSLLVLAGDTPLLQPDTIKQLIDFHQQGNYSATILSAEMANPYGYGRVLRNSDNTFARIVEEKDASNNEKSIKEINSGMYCFQAKDVFMALTEISTNNAQGEYYLTDVLEILKNKQQKIGIFLSMAEEDIHGINDRVQLAAAESLLRQRKNIALMKSGVTLVDPHSTFIDSAVQIGHDTIILPYTFIEGETVIGEHCEIGPGTR
ncbi:MAG: NTP transferase domain-containing protein, partial [Syntrophomonadaceae bacterium]|nr:NTP transferase domain-containing protein [Syntrophomonadaceae bacterium]